MEHDDLEQIGPIDSAFRSLADVKEYVGEIDLRDVHQRAATLKAATLALLKMAEEMLKDIDSEVLDVRRKFDHTPGPFVTLKDKAPLLTVEECEASRQRMIEGAKKWTGDIPPLTDDDWKRISDE